MIERGPLDELDDDELELEDDEELEDDGPVELEEDERCCTSRPR
jgi:hypothetical protein